MNIRLRYDLSIASIDRLEANLYRHNREATGHHDGQGLGFETLDVHGIPIGAVAGYCSDPGIKGNVSRES